MPILSLAELSRGEVRVEGGIAADDPLWEVPSVSITPHIAGSLGNELHRLGESALEEVRRLRAGEPARHPVDRRALAIVAYLQPVSRPEVARIRGVASDSAAGTLLERGLIEESGRSQFGAVLYRTTDAGRSFTAIGGVTF